MDNNPDKIVRLYSRLDSLKRNLPADISINEKYVKEYHVIIDELQETTKSDLSEFKVPDNEIRHIIRSYSYRTKERIYSKDKYCDKNFLMTKLDALLAYFQIKYLSEEKRTIGFKQND